MHRLLTSDGSAAEDVDWPPWIAYGSVAVALGTGAGAALQRGMVLHPTLDLLLIGIAVSPWVLSVFNCHLHPALGAALTIAASAVLLRHPESQDLIPFLLVLLTGEVAARDGYQLAAAAGVASSGVMGGLELAGRYQGALIWIAGFTVAWGIGAAYHEQISLMTQLRAAQTDLATRAAAEERQRIAREVHDVIAHTLAVTMLHLTGARMALQRDDRADAEAALLEAERHGRQSLSDVRRSVGLLSGDQSAMTPEPTAADVVDLVAGYRDAGLLVTLESSGDVAALPLTVGLGVYRITQESLANASRHAPGALVTVRLDVDDHAVRLAVHNVRSTTPAVPSTDGHGIEGIKERAAILGGSASAGPSPDGGWLVEATIPVP